MTMLLMGAGVQAVASGSGDPIGDALRAACFLSVHLDEETGTRIDQSSHGNDLAMSGMVGRVAGKIDQAASFSGSIGDYLSHASNTDFSQDGSWSWSFWFRAPTAVDQCSIIGKLDQSLLFADEYAISLNPTTPKQIVVTVNYDQGLPIESDYTNTYTAGFDLTGYDLSVWHFCVAWLDTDSKILNIKVDNIAGTLRSVQTEGETGQYHNEAVFTMGQLSVIEVTLQPIEIDELNGFHLAITQDQIDYLWNSGSGRALFPAP